MADPYANYPPELHPANYEMKKNPPRVNGLPTVQNTIDEQTLLQLDSMDADALRVLIQRVAGAMWGIGLKTKEEIAEAMLLRLAHTGLTSKDSKDTIAAIREWLDRSEGKPMQRQQSLIAVANTDKALPENDRLALEHYFKIRGFKNA